jgi:hypothetical protein
MTDRTSDLRFHLATLTACRAPTVVRAALSLLAVLLLPPAMASSARAASGPPTCTPCR